MANVPPGCTLSPFGDVIDLTEPGVDLALAGDKCARWSVQLDISAAEGDATKLSPAQLRYLAEMTRRVMAGEESAKVALLDRPPPRTDPWWKQYNIALDVRRMMKKDEATCEVASIAIAKRFNLSAGWVQRIAKSGYWREIAVANLADEEDIAAGRHPSQLWDGEE